jgi:hypothetical protein
MDPEIARNQNYDDHYANDSEDVHSALLPLHDLLFGGGFGYSRWGYGGGFGIGGILLIVLVVYLLVGHGRL